MEAEAVALPLGTWALHEHLRDRDVIWFIDSESAAACAIRGGSNLPEVEAAIQAAHLLWLHLGCRVWIEWVDSIPNPADGLSRLDLEDPWTRTQGWRLEHPGDPPWHQDVDRPDGVFHASGMTLGKRGPCRHWEHRWEGLSTSALSSWCARLLTFRAVHLLRCACTPPAMAPRTKPM